MSIKSGKKLTTGDIFYLQLKDQKKYIFGRVLFDVDKQYHKVVDTNDFADDYFPYLAMSHDGCQLVEMYEGVHESNQYTETRVLIPRVFVKKIDGKFNMLEWGIAGNKKVDYTQVEFPEHLNLANNAICLDRGELSLKTKITESAAEQTGFKTNIFVPVIILDAALFLQERTDLIPADRRRSSYLKEHDLLYNPALRGKIYSDLNLDAQKSYYELSKEKGFDLARFYQ
jgi:hypothetical protein